LTKSDALVAQNKYGEAIEVADKLIEVQPGNPEGYYRKARLLQEQGDVDASFEFYELAIDKAPQSERVLTEFTEMGVSNGRAEQVKARLQGLIEDNPDHPLANSLIGLVNADEKDFAKAEEYFVRQTEITPDQAEPYSRLAQSRLAQGDAEGAVAAFNTGLEALPNNPQLLIGLAGLRERQEDFEVAISLYEKVLEQQPENAISINNLAALLSDHRTDAASLEKAAALAEKLEQTNQPAFLDTAGWVYYRKGDYDKAMEVLKRVVEEAPQVPVFHYHLGMTYFKKGDKAAAKEHLTRATQGDYQYQGIEEARKILESL
jgi:tetratricopeptide (TPR) repeat protein